MTDESPAARRLVNSRVRSISPMTMHGYDAAGLLDLAGLYPLAHAGLHSLASFLPQPKRTCTSLACFAAPRSLLAAKRHYLRHDEMQYAGAFLPDPNFRNKLVSCGADTRIRATTTTTNHGTGSVWWRRNGGGCAWGDDDGTG